jgi:hypothetical protein
VLFGVLCLGWLPHLAESAALVAERTREDQRVVMRGWANQSLEPGWVLVTDETHKLFNPFWGGLGGPWFDWYVAHDIAARPIDQWRRENDIAYAVLPLGAVRAMQASPEGRAYLGGMLHLKTFQSPPARRGPESAFFRLWPAQHPLDVTFGGGIHLVGYDRAPTDGGVSLRFYWRAAQRPTVDYSVYIHLTRADARDVLAQADGGAGRDGRPTSTWADADETLIGRALTLPIPRGPPAGRYRVLVGLYDSATGARLLTGAGQDHTVLFTLDDAAKFH